MSEDEKGLIQKAKQFESRIAGSATNNENVLIVAHHDADGICAASMLSDFILAHHGHSQIRATSEPNARFLERLSGGKYDLVVFVDCCAGLSKEIANRFGDRWLVIDHHEIPDEEKRVENILNPWQFGFDGGRDISTSGLCYYVTEESRKPLSAFLAVVGALSDRQDLGPRRSLVGLNAKILEDDAEAYKAISSKVDLLFSSRESRPVHESIANSLSCFIPGLTGNKDACLASLRSAGIELKQSNRWRTISNFGEEEKQHLLETVVPHLSGTTNTVEDLVGSVYSMSSEDEYSVMRDARDFALFLNACGRTSKPGVGVSFCLGAKSELSNGIEQMIADYRIELIKAVQTLMSSEDRIREKSDYALIVGDGIVNEKMTGAVCQIMASYSRFKNRVVFLRTTTQDGDVKVSSRLGRDVQDVDLGSLMARVAESTQGVGGGLQNGAGARFSIVKQQEFQQAVDSQFQKKKSS